MSKIIQITSGDTYYFDEDQGVSKKHNTLFALDDQGKIWTRRYDGKSYREWFSLCSYGLPKADEDKVEA